MFELLLERVLLNIVGPYIQGIDRQNLQLGIWNGNVSVHNVSIKPEILKMLELPFKMKYSSVGTLNATIPWSNLGSKPVEIVLEDVMLILHPIDPAEWQPIEYKTVTQKLKRIDTFANQYSIKLAQKQNQQKVLHDSGPESQGMAARISARAVDNVQITIRNIHVRFEDPLSRRNYAWGITLDEILLYTTNEKWEREFIDRTIPQNLLLPIRKRLSLRNLGIYWTSDTTDLYGNQPAETIREAMKRQILKDSKATNKKEAYIINISAECKLTQKNKRDPEKRNDPEYDISLQLAPIDLLVRKTQVEDIIHLLGFLSEFQKFQYSAMVQKQKEVIQFLGDTERDIDKEEFKMLLKKIRLNNEHDGLRSLEKVRLALGGPEQAQLFEELLMKLPDEDIGIAIKAALKEAEKEKRIKVFNQNKEEKSKGIGLLSRWFKGKKSDQHIKDERKDHDDPSVWDGDDMEKLEKYLEEAFPAENEIVLDEIRNIVKFDFLLDGGTIFLSNNLPGGKEEGVTLDYKGLQAKINFTSVTKHVIVSLKDFGLNLRTRYSSKHNYIDTNIIRRVNYWLPPEQSGDILTVSFDENPPNKKAGVYLGVKAQQVEIIYRKAAIQRLKNYFSVSTDNEALKSQAMDQIERVQGGGGDQSSKKEQAPSKQQFITVDLEAPILVIPLLQNGDLKSQCWVLNLGHLMVESRQPNKDTEQMSYQMFEIALNKIKLEYYPTHGLYMKVQRSVVERKDLSLLSQDEQEEFRQVFQLVNQFSINVNLDMALPEVERKLEGQGLPKLLVDLTIPSVHLLLRPEVYKCLLRIPELTNFASEDNEMEIVESERTRLMAGNDRLGVLNVQEKRFGNLVWAKYFCILKGIYLHFFKSSSDPRPAFSSYIRNAKVSPFQDKDKSYTFSIENRYNKVILAGENHAQMEQWMQVIKAKIEEYSTTVPNMFDKLPALDAEKKKSIPEKSVSVQPEKNYEAIKAQFSFQIKELKLTIFHTDQLDKLLELETKNFRMQSQSQLGKNTVYVKLESLEIQDYLFQYTNPDLKCLLTSIPSKLSDIENADLIEVNVVIMDQDHPNFKNKMTNNQIIAQFGYLYANFKPKVIRDTLDFFLPPPNETETQGDEFPNQPPPQLMKKSSTLPVDKSQDERDISFVENLNVTTLDLQINFKEICLRLVHMKTHICLNELAVRETNLKIVSKPHFTEFVGNLGNVQLYDTTNYPHTIDSNIEYERINKYELIGVGEPDKNLLEIIYRDYDPKHPEANHETQTYSFVVVNVSTVRINYIQKPVFRFIDYILQQIVPNVVPRTHSHPKHEEQSPFVLTKDQIETAEKKLNDPKFLDLKVYALSPIIALKPEPNSFEYWELKLGDLTVQNEAVKNTTSFKNSQNSNKPPLTFVYFDRYNIMLQNMGIFRVQGQDSTQLSREVNFDLYFEKPMYSHEYHLIYDDHSSGEEIPMTEDHKSPFYQEVTEIRETLEKKQEFFLDETMVLKGKMTPLIAIWNHEDFVLLMKIINYNLAYHDEMDHLFVLEEEEKEESEETLSVDSKKAKKLETPLLIDLRFDNFTLLALDEFELPFCMINLHLLQVSIFKDERGTVFGSIQAYQLNGSYFEKHDDKLFERKMLGQLDRINEHSLSEKRKEEVIEEIVSSLIKYTEFVADRFSSMSDKQKYVQVDTNLKIQTNGKKFIKVNVNGLKGFLVIDIYLALVKFLELDHSVHPPPKPKSELQRQISLQREALDSTAGKEDSLELEVVAKNVLITAPASKGKVHVSPYVLALRGDILFEMKIVPKPALEKALTDIKGKTFYRATEQCTPHNESMHLKASLSHFEVFICEFDEILGTQNFNEVRKRTMILPFTLSYIRKEHHVPNKSQTDLLPVVKNEVNIELMVLRMSYQDALLLNNTIRYQLEHFHTSQSYHNSKTAIDDKTEQLSTLETSSIRETRTDLASPVRLEESQKDDRHRKAIEVVDVQAQIENKDNWEPHLQEFNIGSQGIQIIIINDAEGSLVPVMEFTLQQVIGTMLIVGKKLRLSTRTFLNCSFFNPLPSRWEPIIEKFGFEFELISDENPKQTLLFSMDENFEILNINISEQMLATFYSTIITWKTDYENKTIQQDKSMLSRVALTGWSNKQETGVDVEDELIDYVSPYTIVNQTGYPIQIETDMITGNRNARGSGRQRSYSISSKRLHDLHKKVYKIQDGGKAQYLVESNIEDLFKQSMQDVMVGINYIAVKIMHPTLQINTIMGIDIDKALLKDYPLEATTHEGNIVAGNLFRLVSLVKIDRNKKVITLSSPFKVCNKTQMGYDILIKSPLGEAKRFVKPDGESTIPIGFFEGDVRIRENESNSMTSDVKIEIERLAAAETVKLFRLQTNSSFLLAQSVKKDSTCEFFEVSLQPTFLLKNACAKEVSYRIFCDEDPDSSIQKLEPQEVVHKKRLSIKQTVWIQLRVQGFFWSKKVVLYSPEDKNEEETEILLYDNTGNPLSIFVFSPSKEVGTKKFYFYTKACIINESPYLLDYFVPNDSNHPEKLPGQHSTDPTEVFNPRINLINETERLVLGLKNHAESSKIINISTLGSTFAELMQQEKGSMLELGLDMSVLQCDKEYKLLTKIITISPRYIFLNKTPYNLEIKREGSLKTPVTLGKDTRETFQWVDWSALLEKRISIRLKDDHVQNFWDWTHGFEVTTIGIYNFMAKSYNRTEIKYLKVVITLQKSSIFIVIEEEAQGQSSLKIRNDCPGLKIRAYQENSSPLEGIVVHPGKTVPWSWEFPSQRKTICADFGFEDADNYIPLEQEQIFRFDTLNKLHRVKIPGTIKNQTPKLYSMVTMEGNTRVLNFFLPHKRRMLKSNGALKSLEDHKSSSKPVEKIYNMNLEVHIRGLGISLISAINDKVTKKKERKEVLYLVIKGLEFKWLDSVENSVFQLRMKYLNIDNNIIYDTSFPVLLTPSRPAALGPDTRNYFLDILISQKKLSEIRHIETFQILLDEITARIDGLFLDAVLEMILNFVEIFKDNDKDTQTLKTVAESLFSTPHEANEMNNLENFMTRLSWKERPVPEMTNNVFIQNLIINPIFINLSFQRNRRDVAENILFLIHLFATVLGTALVNLDNAPLKLRGLRLDNVFDSQEAIVKKILDRFKDESAKSIFKILGSLDIVGNPVGLFNNISTGVVDLLEKPLDGFLQGPLEGGKGLIKGTSSLVKNTVSGTFNSIGKVTCSLASGLSSLALDNEYLTQREKNRLQRPNHLGEGVYLGLNSLAKGLGYGLKGAVLDPIEGLQRGGFKGFLRGALKGFSGLFTKPVIGALDAASKTAEGIKNTADMFDQKPNDNRIRFPRAFYGKEKFYRTYMETDAEIVWLLHLSKEAQLMKDISLINAFDIFPDENQKEISFILALSYEYVLLWNVKNARTIWAINPKEIHQVTLFNDGMVIELNDLHTDKKKGKLKIKNCDFSQNEYIANKLVQLKRNT